MDDDGSSKKRIKNLRVLPKSFHFQPPCDGFIFFSIFDFDLDDQFTLSSSAMLTQIILIAQREENRQSGGDGDLFNYIHTQGYWLL